MTLEQRELVCVRAQTKCLDFKISLEFLLVMNYRVALFVNSQCYWYVSYKYHDVGYNSTTTLIEVYKEEM